MKVKYWINQLIGAFIFFAILFVSAGTLNYWQGLVYLGIGVIMIIVSHTALRIDEQLMEERSKPGKGTKKWDKILLGLFSLVTISMYIVAGLDSGRFHWSPPFHWSLYLLGMLLTFSGQLLFLIAQKQNKFFSSTVRIQTNRNHSVCSNGLYSIVRHPGYMGSHIQAIGFPLLFGSIWSIVPVLVLITLFLIRTSFEDRTLKKELKGYSEYADVTRYKLVPYVW